MLDAKIIQKYKGRKDAQLIQAAQKLVNDYVRQRDAINDRGDFVCISCQSLKPKAQCDAGHFFSRGNYSSVRFDLDNVHSQCKKCNWHLSGNLYEYQKNLINKIGAENFRQLERMANLKGFKFDRFTLIDIIERFKNL